MTARKKQAETSRAAEILLPRDAKRGALAIHRAHEGQKSASLTALTDPQRRWLETTGFKSAPRRHVLLSSPDGNLAGAVVGVGKNKAEDPSDRPEIALASLASTLPPGAWRVVGAMDNPTLAATAWGLGAYRFQNYRNGTGGDRRQLEAPADADLETARTIVDAVWLGRDLINTPSNDMGPDELEAAARALAKQHGAKVSSIVGVALLEQNFPLIHAVGRASPRQPRLVEIVWGAPSAPRVTLVGKGICFDTGGLDIKPSAAMLLMKKDMGGAAAVLALGHMIMSTGLGVRLRILLAIAENSVSGDAFRPGDVIRSRAGKTVEIGNTDAEGRLVLADALTLACAEKPDMLATFATLTGAARVAVGPDLAPFYTDDDAFASQLAAAADHVADPVWRMPFWSGYESLLDSPVADMNNVSEGGFAGSVTAALFLRRFAREAKRYVHFDIYGWRPSAKPLGPKGGEVNAARGMFEALQRQYGR